MTYTILVTGSRDWSDIKTLHAALRNAADDPTASWPIIVREGACPTGADLLAHLYANYMGWHSERHPANWSALGGRAGFARNEHMVYLNADVCLAFINPCIDPKCKIIEPHGSHGATHCADLAEEFGIPTERFGFKP